MSIPDTGVWDKGDDRQGAFQGLSRDWVLVGIIILTAALCFGLGLTAARQNQKPGDSLWIEQLPPAELPGSVGTSTGAEAGSASGPVPALDSGTAQSTAPAVSQPAAAAAALTNTGTYVASKSGSKYYLPSCAGAKRIKEENKVWFATKEQAAAKGYTPAANCPGL